MKKILKAVTFLLAPFTLSAQGSDGPYQGFHINMEIFNICAAIFVTILFMVFFLAILKWILEHRLRNKIVDLGVPENLVASLLQKTTPKHNGNVNIKWFMILTGIGAGLMLIRFTLPLGIHSLAIMVFSVAASFLGYYFFLKKTEK